MVNGSARPPGGSPRRLGQNFLADPNLLDVIVREAELGEDDVVLEVGGGGGALTERVAAEAPAPVSLHFEDAMTIDLGALEPEPTRMVANLPYSIATPLLLRTVAELPSLGHWTVMVQREIAERLRARPGSRTYGAPSVQLQLSCDVRMLRAVDPAVFKPRPRVESALLALVRRAPAPPERVRELIRDAFAHRRKALPRSLELAARRREREAEAAGRPAPRPRSGEVRHLCREALIALGLPADARAEMLTPPQHLALAGAILDG